MYACKWSLRSQIELSNYLPLAGPLVAFFSAIQLLHGLSSLSCFPEALAYLAEEGGFEVHSGKEVVLSI